MKKKHPMKSKELIPFFIFLKNVVKVLFMALFQPAFNKTGRVHRFSFVYGLVKSMFMTELSKVSIFLLHVSIELRWRITM